MLVLAGLNGSAYWPQRGHPDVRFPHASVVFAIRPELGFIAREYLAELPGDDSLSPVWYRCLLPPKMSDVFAISRLSRPGSKHDPGRAVVFGVHTRSAFDDNGAGFSWVLDEFGQFAPGSLALNDVYNIHQSELPDPSEVYLGELPPIVSSAESAKRPASTE